MKKLLRLTSIVSAMAALALMTACQTVATNQAELGASKKEFLLEQSGFKTKTVTTAKQQKQVSLLAVDRVSAVKYQGKVYYVFPTGKKDQIYYGNQAQFNAYKQALQAQKTSQAQQAKTQQEQQMLQGSPVWVGETAGPRHITVEEFDGFGPINPMQGD